MICSSKTSAAALQHVKECTGLSWLKFYSMSATDQWLKELSPVPQLKWLDVYGDQITDAGLAHLQGMTELTELHLGGESLTDAGLAHLSRMKNLRVLWLSGIPITGAGLVHLQGMTELRELCLSSKSLTDAGMAHLSRLKNLRVLRLYGAQITGAGLDHLKPLVNLEELSLLGGSVTGDSLKPLSAMTNLRQLALRNSEVTDNDLIHLKGLTGLTALRLGSPKITDAGLVHLSGLKNLKEIWLDRTNVTPEGEERLRRSLPECKINRRGTPSDTAGSPSSTNIVSPTENPTLAELEIPAAKPADDAEKTTLGEAGDVVALYLLDEDISGNALRGDLSKLKLAKKPLLTLQDIIAMDSRGGKLFLKEPARKRLFEGTGWEDPDREFTEAELQQRRSIGRRSTRPDFNLEPFVLVVDGRRILAGHIMGPIASPITPAIGYSGPGKSVPLLLPEKQAKALVDALRRERKLTEQGNPVGVEELLWDPKVAGLRCRLIAAEGPVTAGSSPRVTIEIQNATKQPVEWTCQSGATLGLRPQRDGIPVDWSLPAFRVNEIDDVKQTAESGTTVTYRFMPGGRLRLTATLPWSLDGPGRYPIEAKVSRQPITDGGFNSDSDGWSGSSVPALRTTTIEVVAADEAATRATKERNAREDLASGRPRNTLPADTDSRQRFLEIERIARLPMAEQAKELPHLYRDLAPPIIGGLMGMSSYRQDILDPKSSGFPEGDADKTWAEQLADAAGEKSPEEMADTIESGNWLKLASRARALWVFGRHAEAMDKLLQSDLDSEDKSSVGRAARTINAMQRTSLSGKLLEIYLADDEMSKEVWGPLIFMDLSGIVEPLLRKVEKDPRLLIRCAGLFQGPLYGEPAEPMLLELVSSADKEISYHAAYALYECKDAKLAPPAAKFAKDPAPRFRLTAAYWAANLPGDAFNSIRTELLPLLTDVDEEVRFKALRCFAQQKDMAAGPVILELLRRDQIDRQYNVTVMQAMSKLTGSTFNYSLHNWGPGTAGNQRAIEKFEAWLKDH